MICKLFFESRECINLFIDMVRVSTVILLCIICIFMTSCNTEEPPPEPEPAVIVKTYDWLLEDDGSPFFIDIDGNGLIDYTITITIDHRTGFDKAIFRLKGEISGIYTSSIYAPLKILTESELCNVFYTTVLAATIFESEDSLGNHLDPQWRFTGDFHHGQSCVSPSCSCPTTDSDITYIPVDGRIGYIGLRFIIKNRKHFAWMEVENMQTIPEQYTLKRIAYNRFPEATISIPQ